MFGKNIIRLFYIIFTFYALFIFYITNLALTQVLPAILLMWGMYAFFSLGNHSKGKEVIKEYGIENEYITDKKFKFLFVAVSSLFFSFFAIRFYTGQTPVSVISNLMTNISLYSEYQEHFKVNNIGAFSIAKLPFIIMMAAVKFSTFFCYLELRLSKSKTSLFQWICMILIILSYAYIGIGRGTNFEMFELVVLFISVMFLKTDRRNIFRYILLFGFIIIAISIFSNVISLRGSNFSFVLTRDIIYIPDDFFSKYFPIVIFGALNIFSYFGFGFFYVSTFIEKVWLSSFSNIFSNIFPFMNIFFGKGNIDQEMSQMIDIGARWHPDSVLFIYKYGLLMLLFVCFLFGVLTKVIQNEKKKTTFDYLTIFFMILQMLSFPIGNFIVASSSSEIATFILALYWINKLFLKKKIILMKRID